MIAMDFIIPVCAADIVAAVAPTAATSVAPPVLHFLVVFTFPSTPQPPSSSSSSSAGVDARRAAAFLFTR